MSRHTILLLTIILYTAHSSPLPASEWVLKKAFPNLSFSRPLSLVQIPAPGDLLFIAEQGGNIFSFENDRETTVKALVLDLSTRVLSNGNEQGLLGLALTPKWSEAPALYVNYTAANPTRTVVSRFALDAHSGIADPSSEKVLLEVPQPFSNHNGGMLAFGPDGYLYIGLGDGGSGGDPLQHGQNPHTLLASILRIDPTENGYHIPADNPFATTPELGRAEIWAYGLRNPWRFSFDRVTGTLWAGDVGQNAFEEIDIILPGRNYGWNTCEGMHRYPQGDSCPAGTQAPLYEYDHSEGRSITGGYVYRGTEWPELFGHYLYADFVSRRVWALNPETTTNRLLATADEPIASFGEDRNGNLYLLGFAGDILSLQTGP
ncbi:MAG: PQQ-dependent sugar dehydrogenase [Bdellovibrionales bacterium]|nr:PQQ-dependent sugar dehydrogenase [Bdellovibrionales bacterium]